MIETQQRDRGAGALHVPSHLDKMPAFAVAHGGIGHALNQVHAFDHGQEKIRGQHVIGLIRFVPRHLVKQMVKPLPLVGADFFAYLARVLAGRRHAGCDG